MDLKPEHWVKHPEEASIDVDDQIIDQEDDQEEDDCSEINNSPMTAGELRIIGNQGIALLYSRDEITLDGYVAPVDVLKNAVLCQKNAPVLLNNEKVGYVSAIRYDRARKGVFAHITLTVDSLPKSSSFYNALAVIEDLGFLCGTCGLKIQIGQSPCQCLFTTSSYILFKISIMAVNLLQGRHDIITMRSYRDSMLRRYFAGAINSILFLEEI